GLADGSGRGSLALHLRGDAQHPPHLDHHARPGLLAHRPGARDMAGAVRVPQFEIEDPRVGVAGAHDDRAPVVEGVVHRQDRRLLAAVAGRGRHERRHHLVDELALGPQAAGLVDELPDLRARHAVAGRCAPQDRVGPLEVVERRLLQAGDGLAVGRPVLVGTDRLRRRELLDLAESDLGAGRGGLVGGGLRHLVDVAGLGVVDDGQFDHGDAPRREWTLTFASPGPYGYPARGIPNDRKRQTVGTRPCTTSWWRAGPASTRASASPRWRSAPATASVWSRSATTWPTPATASPSAATTWACGRGSSTSSARTRRAG